jgi:hypothetical protein
MENKADDMLTYRSNSKIIVVGAITIIALFIAKLAQFDFSIPKNPLLYVLFFSMALLVWSYRQGIYISVTSEKIIVRSVPFIFLSKKEIPFKSIDTVRRVRPHLMRAFGDSYITLYFRDGSYVKIHEAFYEVSVIKDFVTTLRTKLPWIDFDKQYIDLIEGKNPSDETFRHLVPLQSMFFPAELYDRYFS